MSEKITLELGAVADPKLILAIRTIGTGLVQLAEALEGFGKDAAERPAPRPSSARPSSSKTQAEDEEAESPAAEEADNDDQDIEPVDLPMLQKSAKALIRDGKREGLKGVLKKFDLANVSSAKPDQFEELYKALSAL